MNLPFDAFGPLGLAVQAIACAMVIARAGYVLSVSADRLAQAYGWGRGWVGLALLATVTSLPELASGLSAVTLIDAPNLAVGNALGACVFNLVFLVVVDALQRDQPMYRNAQASHLLSAGFGVVMLAFVALSMAVGRDAPVLLHVGYYSPVLLLLYLVALRNVHAHDQRLHTPSIAPPELPTEPFDNAVDTPLPAPSAPPMPQFPTARAAGQVNAPAAPELGPGQEGEAGGPSHLQADVRADASEAVIDAIEAATQDTEGPGPAAPLGAEAYPARDADEPLPGTPADAPGSATRGGEREEDRTDLHPASDSGLALALAQQRRDNWQRFALAALATLVAGLWLPAVADALAQSAGLSRSFVGTVFMAAVTALPEMAVTLSALRLGALDLALGNLLGSNLFNLSLLALDDLAYTRGALLASVGPEHAATAATALLMTGLVIVGLVLRPKGRVLRVASWISIGLIAAYAVNASVSLLAAG